MNPNTQNLLAQLRDIHTPKAVSIWPLAPGWYMLAGLASIMICVAIVWNHYRWYQRRFQRAALQELEQYKQQCKQSNDYIATITELSSLLRRSTLAKYERHKVAGLHGETWLQFLDKTGETEAFTTGCGRVLISAPYQRQASVNMDNLFVLLEDWIKKNL